MLYTYSVLKTTLWSRCYLHHFINEKTSTEETKPQNIKNELQVAGSTATSYTMTVSSPVMREFHCGLHVSVLNSIHDLYKPSSHSYSHSCLSQSLRFHVPDFCSLTSWGTLGTYMDYNNLDFFLRQL